MLSVRLSKMVVIFFFILGEIKEGIFGNRPTIALRVDRQMDRK
jgi:hypothetical protein